MKATIFAVLGVFALATGWVPPTAEAQTCCQYVGACLEIGGATGTTEAECVSSSGQPTSGSCIPEHGVCGGTVVCCDTTCRGPERTCETVTASTCIGLHHEAIPVADATCSSTGDCRAQCAAGCTEAGQVFCDGDCVSLESDPLNCGECGEKCRAGEFCSAGQCIAKKGLAEACSSSQECGTGCCEIGGCTYPIVQALGGTCAP